MKLSRIGFVALLLLAFAAEAQQSTLIIRSDADCALTVNGMPQGQATAGAAKPVPVGPGEQLVECAAAGGVKTEEVLEVFPGAQKVVKIQLANKVALQTRFKADGNFVVDTKTGLSWLAADNGDDIEWNAAMSYCARFSSSLPSMSELEGIFGPGGAKASPAFKLYGMNYWSNESTYLNGFPAARFIDSWDGRKYSGLVPDTKGGMRAVCVRRRS